MSASKLRGARGAVLGARSRLAALLAEIGSVRVSPRYRGLHWLSATAVLLFFVQLVTGVLLALYYDADPGSAYSSTRFLMVDVPAGWLVRGMHAWAGELLVIVVLAHVVRQFLRRAYLRPREGEWVLGVLLLLIALAFRFTGRLLPWDDIGLAVAQRGLDLIHAVPIAGPVLAAWLSPGEALGPDTLSRFFATHVLVLPWITALCIAVSVGLVARHGLKGDEP
ncbi:MAG: cytochrome b N-terminal domain-containing protein [Planctomycetes bacterium]|nr:cytochrome b N-terminal domain-containing protein [Planctomycetota bacterium]